MKKGYEFIYHLPEDGIETRMVITDPDITWMQLLNHFERFLNATGYVIKHGSFEEVAEEIKNRKNS